MNSRRTICFAIVSVLGLLFLSGQTTHAQPAPRKTNMHGLQNPWFSQPGETVSGQKPSFFARKIRPTLGLRRSIQKDIRAMGKISRKMYKELNKKGDHGSLKGKHVDGDMLFKDKAFAEHYDRYSKNMAALMERGGFELFKASGLPGFKPAGEHIARSWRKEVLRGSDRGFMKRIFTRPLGASVKDMADSPFLVAALFTHTMSNTGVGKWRNSKFHRAAKRAVKNAMESREVAMEAGDLDGFNIADTQIKTLEQAMGEGEYWATLIKHWKDKRSHKNGLLQTVKNNLKNEMINVEGAVQNSVPTKQTAAAAAGALMTAAGAAYMAHQEGIKINGKDMTFIADIDQQVNNYIEKFGDVMDEQSQSTIDEFMKLRRQIGGIPSYINHPKILGESGSPNAVANNAGTKAQSIAETASASAGTPQGESIQVTDPDSTKSREPEVEVLDRPKTAHAGDAELSDENVAELNKIVEASDNKNKPAVPVIEPNIEPIASNEVAEAPSPISKTSVASSGKMASSGKYAGVPGPMARAAQDSNMNILDPLAKAGKKVGAGAKKLGNIFSKSKGSKGS